MQYFTNISRITYTNIPKEGWLKSIRQALDMSSIQLAKN
jgi:hypothetical protein